MSAFGRLTMLAASGVVVVLIGQGLYSSSGEPETARTSVADTIRAAPGDTVQPLPAFINDTYPTSTVYSVKVNDTPVPVTSYKTTAYGQFGFSGTARITITMDRPVPAGLIVSPLSAKVKYTVTGNTISLTTSRPRRLALHWGGPLGLTGAPGLPEKLFLFAEPLEEGAPKPGQANVVDVATFRPNTQGTAFTSTQLQAAVDSLKSGQTLYIGPGTYNINKTLTVNRKTNVKVYLAPGALLRATTVNTGKAGIYVLDSSAVTIFGSGGIDLNGTYFRPKDGFNTPIQVRTLRSDRTVIQGLLMRDAPEINVFTVESPYTMVDGVKILAEIKECNTDGIDFQDGSHHSSLTDSFIYNTDDGMAPGYAGNLSDLNSRNVITWTSRCGSAVKQASPQDADPKAVLSRMTYENVDQIYGEQMVMLWPESHAVSDYYFKGFRSEGFAYRIMDVSCAKGSKNCSIKNVRFVNFDAPHAGSPKYPHWEGSRICGQSATQTVEGLSFDNVRIKGVLQTSRDAFGKNAPLDLNGDGGGCDGIQFTKNWSFSNTRRPTVNISATDVYAGGSAGTATFTLNRTGSSAEAVSVPLEIMGTARNGVDYATVADTVTIPAGATKATITVTPQGTPPAAGQVATVRIRLANAPLSTAWVVGPNYVAQAVIRS